MENKQNSKLRKPEEKFYKLMSAIPTEFRNVLILLCIRNVVNALRNCQKERYLRGMIQWVGFKKKYVPYVVESRRAGKPKYNINKLAKLVLSGVTSFRPFL